MSATAFYPRHDSHCTIRVRQGIAVLMATHVLANLLFLVYVRPVCSEPGIGTSIGYAVGAIGFSLAVLLAFCVEVDRFRGGETSAALLLALLATVLGAGYLASGLIFGPGSTCPLVVVALQINLAIAGLHCIIWGLVCVRVCESNIVAPAVAPLPVDLESARDRTSAAASQAESDGTRSEISIAAETANMPQSMARERWN